MSNDERATALLTPSQREYLRGESDIEEKSSHERATRARIRNRLRNSIFDLSLLQSTLESRDVKRAFSDDNDSDDPREWRHIFNNISQTLALIFDGISRNSKYDHVEEGDEHPNSDVLAMFAHFTEDAIERMYVTRGVEIQSVDVDIDVEFGDQLTDLSDKELTDLSEDQLEQLAQAGKISTEEWIEALKEITDDDVRVISMDSKKE